MATTHADVVVVGAGIAGLACACLLADTGLRVQVLEASAVPGGRARSWHDPAIGEQVDIGPHVLLSQYANMRALLGRLGTADAVCWQTEELLTVLDRGRHIHFRVGNLPPPLNYACNLPAILPSVPLQHLLSNLPLAWRTLRGSDAFGALDTRTGRDYLHSLGVSPGFIDWFWASAAMALLNVPVEQCSAAALMRLFVQALGHRHLAFGLPQVGLSELYARPAIRYIEQRGGTLRLDCASRGLWRRDGAVAGVALADGTRVEAPAVVLAVPPGELAALLPAGHPLAAIAQHFEPSPYVSCYLRFDRRITGSRFWARPWSSGALNTDFYDLANIRPTEAGAGSLVASNIIWSHRADGLSDQAIIEATRREIADFAPQAATARLLAAAVHRIPMAVPCALPGIESIRPATQVEPGLFLAGDWVDTGLPFCMESATRAAALAAEAVLAERGRRVPLALPVPTPGGLVRLLGRR